MRLLCSRRESPEIRLTRRWKNVMSMKMPERCDHDSLLRKKQDDPETADHEQELRKLYWAI